jgi:hypothetical protein
MNKTSSNPYKLIFIFYTNKHFIENIIFIKFNTEKNYILLVITKKFY